MMRKGGDSMADTLPARMDFYAKQGDSFNSGLIQYKRGDVVLDLSNATGKCQIRNEPYSGIVGELIVNTVNDPDKGWCYWLEQDKSIMATLPALDTPYTKYYQDVEFTWTSGYRQTLTEGTLYLSPEVTKQ